MFYTIATIALSIIIAAEILFDYKKQRFRWKIPLLILIVWGSTILYFNTKEKEKLEQERWRSAQWYEDARNRNLTEALRKGPEEKKKNLFEDSYRETASGFLDMNYLRLKDLFGTNRKIGEQYLTVYFSEVGKIPDFYTWEEWKETESLLFNNMRESLKGYYISRNPYDNTHRNKIVAEFVKERDKYIKAKERQYNNK